MPGSGGAQLRQITPDDVGSPVMNTGQRPRRSAVFGSIAGRTER